MQDISHISSFDSILKTIQPRTHIFCDIDDTVLKVNMTDSKCFAQGCFSQDYMCPTDATGFYALYNLVNSKQISGKLSFLTARNVKDDIITRMQLSNLGIPVTRDVLDIYYTNNMMNKGDYMKMYLKDHVNSGMPIVFIDDRPTEVFSVWAMFPHIKCYVYTAK